MKNVNGNEGNTLEKKPFFQRTWVMWVLLFLFAPAGIFLLFKYSTFKKVPKIALSAAFGVCFLLVAISSFTPNAYGALDQSAVKTDELNGVKYAYINVSSEDLAGVTDEQYDTFVNDVLTKQEDISRFSIIMTYIMFHPKCFMKHQPGKTAKPSFSIPYLMERLACPLRMIK